MVKISVKDINGYDVYDGLVIMGISDSDMNINFLEKYSNIPSISEKVNKIERENLVKIKKFGKSMIYFIEEHGKILKFMVLGIGNRNELKSDDIRKLGGIISLKARDLDFRKIIIPNFFDTESDLEYLIEGLTLSLYEFNKYKEKNNSDSSTSFYDAYSVDILIDGKSNKLENTVDRIVKLSKAVFYARDLSNSPPNLVNPEELANSARALEKEGEGKINVSIMDYEELKSKGLNGIVSVGKGSINEPKLIAIEYNNTPTNDKPILLVGKAVTFDTGGISLKPSDKMDEMKFDKSGGCTVLGIMKALNLLKLPVNVVALIPSVENMPSGSSYRPGDIIRMYNGKTVEVLNTDAEGRLILADALSYGVSNYSPKLIIDFATLTGACIIALGTNIAGIMGNNNELINEIISTSDITGEKIWQLPLTEEFSELIKSRVADIKNIGGRTGGAITAAAFLKHFVNDTPWAHIDIAGTAWTQDGTIDKSYNPKGSTGFGVRTLIKFLERKL